MDLPPSLREPPMAELVRELQHSWNPIFIQDNPYASIAVHTDQQRVTLDLLLALAWVREYRAEHGAWPSALPPLYPERAVLLPTSLRLQPGPADTLSLLPDEALLATLTAAMTPEERAQHPFEVTASP